MYAYILMRKCIYIFYNQVYHIYDYVQLKF